MSDNPFDQLGLKKDILIYLYTQGKLEPFLKSFYHLAQINIHPDHSGSHDLSALINSAYQNIKQSPSNIDSWLKTMQNGANPEYLELIEGLAGEVERLKKTEKDYEALKLQYAELLTGKKGEEEKVKTPPKTKTRTTTAPPKVSGFGASSPPRSTAHKTPEAAPSTEPIELHDIVLYDLKTKPAVTYKTLLFDGEALKSLTGNYFTKHADDWTAYYQSRTDKKIPPCLPLLYAIIEKMQETDHPGKAGVLKDLKDSWLFTSTRLNYKNSMVTHNFGFDSWQIPAVVPSGDHKLKDIKKNKAWRTVLQALLMPKDLDQAIETLQQFSRLPPYIWTLDDRDRRTHPERAVWLSAVSDRLNLDADHRPVGRIGRSRGWILK